MNADLWLQNPLLRFNAHTTSSVKTGEVLTETHTAMYKGLRFIITPTKTGGVVCSVRGSLHKYKNNGQHNANDFTIEDVREVVQELESLFNIDTKRATLRTLEYGVNLATPIPTKAILKNLVAYNNKAFESMQIDNYTVGKVIKKQQYHVKVYDKKQQHAKAVEVAHLTRFEIAIKRMAYLSKHNIKTLHDVTLLENWQVLSDSLKTAWSNIIYFDKQMNYRLLSQSERLKLMYYATPRNWEDYNPKQRQRAKAHFSKVVAKAGKTTHYQDVSTLIRSKVGGLCLLSERVGGAEPNQAPPTATTQKRVCRCCGSDISHKKRGAVYCSKRCNNKYNQQRRTRAKREQIGVRKCKCCQTDISHKKIGALYCSKSCSNKTRYHKPKDLPEPIPLTPVAVSCKSITQSALVLELKNSHEPPP